MPFFHPPLTPPVKGGEFKRMPFIPALPGGAFWHVLVKSSYARRAPLFKPLGAILRNEAYVWYVAMIHPVK